MPPYSAKLVILTLAVLGSGWPVFAQGAAAPAQAAPPAPPSFTIANLRPALANVQTAISGLSVTHWKASSETRVNTLEDISSMQKDLTSTLPDLMTQAENASGSGALSPAFAVFRNLDALYDVLLRVTETAALAGPSSDANVLEDARSRLEDGRGKLGAWLLQSMTAQDAQVARMQAPAAHAAAPPPQPTRIVVNDGPDSTTKPRRKKPAPAQPSQSQPAQSPQ